MKKLILVTVLIAIIFLLGLVWWENGLSPANPANKQSVTFIVKNGSGLKDISSKLETAGLIKNRIVFFLYARLGKYEGKIQAGDFNLSPSMNASEIARNLTHGTFDVQITIPEGKRATEIAKILKDNIPTYDPSWISVLVTNEGYLFPETYNISKDSNIEMIVNKMKETFDLNYSKISTVNSGLNKSQVVILASLIEREAITDEERSVIAGILINRLNAGIPLQVDATIQYAKGQDFKTGKWWEPVTIEEYSSVKSAYNTYLHVNLPPGPISNPGLKSLEAAANPTKTNYLYYLHDKNGQIRYAKTIEEHNANIQKYL